MSLKLAKLEAMVENLESLAGMSPQVEIVEVGAEPLTDAPIIIERVRFPRGVSGSTQALGVVDGGNCQGDRRCS